MLLFIALGQLLRHNSTARRFRPGSRLAEKSVPVERILKKGVIVNILKLCLSPNLIRQLCQLLRAFTSLATTLNSVERIFGSLIHKYNRPPSPPVG